MSKAGRNTPASVGAYIEAVWAHHDPPDPIDLARELGYSPKGIRRLQEKHGDHLLPYLQRIERERTEQPRFMARQQGALKPEQYVDTHHGAIDDLEAVDEDTLLELTEQARRKQADAITAMVAAIADLRAAVHALAEIHPAFRYQHSRDVYLVLGRVDALERNVRRRHAA